MSAFPKAESSSDLPTILTERLLLRARTLADTDACLEMDRGPSVVQFIDGPWSDPVEHRAFIEARTCGPYPAGLGYWVSVQRSAPRVFTGWTMLTPSQSNPHQVEIGWRVRREFWGQGFATEAADAILAYAFEDLALASVHAEIVPANVASIQVAEKIGLLQERRMNNRLQTAVGYALACAEYHSAKLTHAPPDRN